MTFCGIHRIDKQGKAKQKSFNDEFKTDISHSVFIEFGQSWSNKQL